MKEKRLETAWKLRDSINGKRGNLKEAELFIANMDKRPRIIIKGSLGYSCPGFTVPARLAKDVLGVMHTLLAQDLKAAEEVFKRL